ncbi:MAG: hypothetical protein CHACPFDD_02054 [Phycisphaerae bacterium]|nr:hypothetical protein [Phycisphaerae bacterium]
MAHTIRIGTSGWSYDDWVGPFYPAGTRKGDYLSIYAGRFGLVEVDSTYYAIPARRTVEGWAERTPDEFRFALKVPGIITHEKLLANADADMEAFLAAVAPLGEKADCLLLQFGYFNRAQFASAGPFFERLDAFLSVHGKAARFACEIRNKQWLTRDYVELLRKHDVACALVEHAWLPPIDQLITRLDVRTGRLVYVRLIGDRQAIEAVTTTWDRVVVDRAADLTRVAGAIRQLARDIDVITFVNNHYAGHGPATARELQSQVGEK